MACIDIYVVDNMVYMIQSARATRHGVCLYLCSGQHGVHDTVNKSSKALHVLIFM